MDVFTIIIVVLIGIVMITRLNQDRKDKKKG
jgi:hypothetical protein